jgi:hypothetical protein
MSHNNDNSGMLYFGGLVVIVIVVGLLIKILKSIMIELSLLFAAIGKATSAFILMAWQIAQVLGLLALGMAAIYAAWVFSKKYYQLVKDATEVKAQIEARFSELQSEINDSFKSLRREANREISQMRLELDEALKRSEAVPDHSDSNQATTEAASTVVETTTSQEESGSTLLNEEQVVIESTDQVKVQIQDTPKDISNPF